MNQTELRAKIRGLMSSGTLPRALPAFENVGPGQDPPVTKIEVVMQGREHCLICEELGPQVSYTYSGGKVVRLHIACDVVWQQERAL